MMNAASADNMQRTHGISVTIITVRGILPLSDMPRNLSPGTCRPMAKLRSGNLLSTLLFLVRSCILSKQTSITPFDHHASGSRPPYKTHSLPKMTTAVATPPPEPGGKAAPLPNTGSSSAPITNNSSSTVSPGNRHHSVESILGSGSVQDFDFKAYEGTYKGALSSLH